MVLLVLAAPGLAYGSVSHPFILQWGDHGIEPGEFAGPKNIAIDPDGSIYVTDAGNARVQKFDGNGTLIGGWGAYGSDNGQFHSPSGIATGANHTIHVADSALNRIQTFDEYGNYISQWGTSGRSPGEFMSPEGVAVNSNGDVYVVDAGNDRVQKFTTEGEHLAEFGAGEYGRDGFRSPAGITIDADSNVLVSDTENSNIKKFDSDGNLLKVIDSSVGGIAVAAGGLHADPEGNLYVADTAHNRILRLDSQGTSLAIWGNGGIRSGEFQVPTDLALDGNGDLYVVDSNVDRIQKFSTPVAGKTPVQETVRQIPAQLESQETKQPAPKAIQPVAGDLTKPEIIPPNDLTIEATGPLTALIVGQATARDESGIKSLVHNAPAEFSLGENTVIWTAIDGAGNLAVAQQIVTVIDSTSPEVSEIVDITMEAVHPEHNTIELIRPNATDIVGIASISNDAPESFPIGRTAVTWTITDIAGNTAFAVQRVDITDTTVPRITAPQDILYEAESPENTIELGKPRVTDSGLITSVTSNAPPTFGLGNTTVTWTAADSAGNTATAKQLVTIQDTTPPQITAPDDITSEAVSADSNVLDTGLPDVADIQAVSITSDAPASFLLGDTMVTWTATDAGGNAARAIQIVSIVDTTPPVAQIKNVVAEAKGPDNAVNLGNITASDATGIAQITSDAPESFPLGDTIVTWTILDDYANAASVIQTVTVIDTTPPAITAPADVISEAIGAENLVELGVPEASDAIGVVTVTSDAPASYMIGATTVTWSATDTSGNSASDVQTVLITDTTPPQITAPQNVTAEAAGPDGATPLIGDATATDGAGASIITNDAPDMFPIGSTMVTWTGTDSHGNAATAVQEIIVTDTIPPVIVPPSDITHEATGPLSIIDAGFAAAEDAVGIKYIQNDAPESFPPGRTVITWTAGDAAGNTAQAVQTITITDTVPPEIAPPADITLESISLDNAIPLKDAAASDIVGVESVTSDAPESFQLGSTVITWTALDSAGNSASAEQTVTITDTTPPTVTAPANVRQEAIPDGNAIQLLEPIANDIYSMTITNDAPELFMPGQTTVTWSVEDASQNTATARQTVTITDTTPPVIEAPPDLILEASSVSGNTADIGVAVADDIVGVLSVSNDAPAAFPYGLTVVTWNATDGQNSAAATQMVTVIDTTPPEITPPADITVQATTLGANQIDIGTADAADIIGIESLYNDAPELFPLGNTTVIWTATDQDGNAASITQTVSVIDTAPPELAIPHDIIIDATSLDTAVDIGNATVTDLTDPNPTVTHDAPELFPLGLTVITWTGTDVLGNTISHTQNIDVQACGRPIEYYNTIQSSPADDVITGTPLPDLVFALGGDDTVSGHGGNDCIFGGEGDDIIFGQQGDDGIRGGGGNDILKGNSGNDSISGGSGTDVIDGGDDYDTCHAGTGDVQVKCES